MATELKATTKAKTTQMNPSQTAHLHAHTTQASGSCISGLCISESCITQVAHTTAVHQWGAKGGFLRYNHRLAGCRSPSDGVSAVADLIHGSQELAGAEGEVILQHRAPGVALLGAC